MRDPFKPRSRSRVSEVRSVVEDAEPLGDTKKLEKAVTKMKSKKSSKIGSKAKDEATEK
jgi:hypothetical protein